MTFELQPRGQFGNKPLVAACTIDPTELGPTQAYGGGVQFAHHYIYGSFRADDGTMYDIMGRDIFVHGPGNLTGFSNRNRGTHLEPIEEFFDACSGLWMTFPTGDGGLTMTGFAIPPSAPREPFELTVTKTGTTWKEGSLLDITGTYVGNCGLQWLTPIAGGAHMHIYHMQRASGTILGQAVEGFYDIGAIYSPPGTSYFTTLGGQYQTWVSFGTEYDDGTMEVGQICVSEGDWSFALIANQDGPIVLTTDVSAKGSFDEAGYPLRTVYDVDGEAWEFVGIEGGGLLRAKDWAAPIQQAEGIVRRVGDTRTIVTSMGNNAANTALPKL
jgi:hypothetical protein